MSFIALFFILVILLSFISVIMLLLFILFLYTSTFSITHTLIRSLLMTLDSHVQGVGHLLILFRHSCDRRLVRCRSFPLIDSGIRVSYVFLLFHDSRYIYIRFSLYFSSLFIWYHAWILVCNIAVIVDLLWFRFIPCSGNFRLSLYMGDSFLAYIHRRLSSWLRFHIFWEAGRERVFLESEPGST